MVVPSLGRVQTDLEALADRLGVARHHAEAWHVARVLQPRDGGLGGADPRRELRLGEAGAVAGFNQSKDHLVDRSEPVVLGLERGIFQHPRLQDLEVCHWPTSLARRSASASTACGVCWVFFTSART